MTPNPRNRPRPRRRPADAVSGLAASGPAAAGPAAAGLAAAGLAAAGHSGAGPAAPGPAVDSWDHVAPWYDSLAADQGSEYHRAVVIPGVLRLLTIRPGDAVLDVACGQGAVARAMQEAGARVVGVDLSPRLVDAARKRTTAGIRYLVGDARKLPDLGGVKFDAAVCVLAMQNIEPMEPVFTGVAALLKPGGRFVTVVNHPAFRIPRQSRWKLDEGRKLLLREVDGYLTAMKIPIDMRPFKRPGQAVTYTHHRPLQKYVEAIVAAGMSLDALEEWPSHRMSQPGPRARAENRARNEFPLFLALRATKAGAGQADDG